MDSEQLKALLTYDPGTGLFKWRSNRRGRGGIKAGDVAGTTHIKGYVQIKVLGALYLAHRLAWFYVHGEWPSAQIDHVNGCRNDNRLINLRLATAAQNGWNSKCHRDNRTGLKGVLVAGSKFEARIMRRGQIIRIGRYNTPDDAHAAYVEVAARLDGEFARFI